LGGTINFDQLSKTEVLEVLELMKPYDEFQVLTRNKMSKSVGNLDQITKSPETVGSQVKQELFNVHLLENCYLDGNIKLTF